MKRKEFLSSILGIGLGSQLPTLPWEQSAWLQDKIHQFNRPVDGHLIGWKTNPIAKVRVAIIGLGNRGQTLLEMCSFMIEKDWMEIVAFCDLQEAKNEKAQEKHAKWSEHTPKLFHGSAEDWKTMLKEIQPDLTLICTPWEWHAQMSIFAMESGSHVACEVPIAYSLRDCWDIIQTAEKTEKHCIMLENCCYNDEELFVLNLVEQGYFGELTHAEGAYLHDLRAHMLSSDYYEDQWRLHHHIDRTGNLYTTHGLGPIAMYMNIGRGDYLDHLTSMSSLEQNLSEAARQKSLTPDSFVCGDMNTTMIKTKKGKTIMLQFDTHTGQPYSRINKLVGTQAVHHGYPGRLYQDGEELAFWGHNWMSDDDYQLMREEHRHPVVRKLKSISEDFKQGHGGMDFIMMYRLIRALNEGHALDLSVYDGVLWSAVTPLSEISVVANSSSVLVPDFTGGHWNRSASLPWLAADS